MVSHVQNNVLHSALSRFGTLYISPSVGQKQDVMQNLETELGVDLRARKPIDTWNGKPVTLQVGHQMQTNIGAVQRFYEIKGRSRHPNNDPAREDQAVVAADLVRRGVSFVFDQKPQGFLAGSFNDFYQYYPSAHIHDDAFAPASRDNGAPVTTKTKHETAPGQRDLTMVAS